MNRNFLFKFLAIGGLIFLLMILMLIVGGLISERAGFREDARRDIAQSWTGAQTVNGAILVAPYTVTTTKERTTYKDGEKQTIEYQDTANAAHYLLPDTLKVTGDLQTQLRYRGIHGVPVYTAALDISGQFVMPSVNSLGVDPTTIVWGDPYLSFGVGDIRGIGNNIALTVDGKPVPISPGSALHFVGDGVHAPIGPVFGTAGKVIDFNMKITLSGLDRLNFIPTGRLTEVTLTSPWNNPSFVGEFLPKSHDVSETGFTANWETSYFSTNMDAELARVVENREARRFSPAQFGVTLYQGVDIYRQSARAVKYALLFIALTFGAFFFFEVARNLAIHPIQYGLVGAALALFYVLLISISEHTSFTTAYILSTVGCVGLITFYVCFVLRSVAAGLSLGSILALLYGAIYVMLGSDAYSLLLGSIVLFLLLTLVMTLTRNLNWYGADSVPDTRTPPEV